MSSGIVISKRYWYDRYAYTIQLWSFDFAILNEIFDTFLKIWDFQIKNLVDNKLNIIETTLYAFLNENNIKVKEIDGYIGVEGNHGQDGAEVYV